MRSGSELVLTDGVFEVSGVVHSIAAPCLLRHGLRRSALCKRPRHKLRSKPLVLAMITGKQNHSPSVESFESGASISFFIK